MQRSSNGNYRLETLIRQVSKLLTAEEKVKMLIWVGEIELIRAQEDSELKEEKRIIKRSDEDQELYFRAALFDIVVQRKLKKEWKVVRRYTSQQSLTDEELPYYLARTGIITMFEKAMVLGNPKDAISYYLNKRGRKTKYGKFIEFIIGEIPVIPSVQPVTIYLVKEPAIEKRKAIRRWRRKHGITRLHHEKYLHNTLVDFASGKKILTPKERDEEYSEKREAYVEKLKERDRVKAEA